MICALLAVVMSGVWEVPETRAFGAVAAPSAMPARSLAVYGLVGAPEAGAGFRQGFGAFEFEARAMLNVLQLSALGEVGLRFEVLELGRITLAPGLALGLLANSGARVFDNANFAFVGLRPRLSAMGTYRFSALVEGVAMLELPLALALAKPGFQFAPLAGAGVEIHLGKSISLLASGHLGADVTKEALGMLQVRPAWAIRLGVGYRVF